MVWLRAIQIQLIWCGLGLYKFRLYGTASGYTNPAYMVSLSAIQIKLMYGFGLYQIQLIWYGFWRRAIQIQRIPFGIGQYKSC